MELPGGSAAIVVAACDLDKTLYPPQGPNHVAQLRANIKAMFAFEAVGGFVFPVTGNNLLLAQRKFQDPDKEGVPLRELRRSAGIFTNGGLVLGPNGIELERHSLGRLQVKGTNLDFVTSVVDFYDAEVGRLPLLDRVGIFCLTHDEALFYERASCNCEAYAEHMMVAGQGLSREELLSKREEVLLLLFLFPALRATDAAAREKEYQEVTRPWQAKVVDALRERGLADCSYEGGEVGGVGNGIQVTLMRDPWPEVDINVAGVDKGRALARFLQNPDVLRHVGQERIDPSTQVAVFGDAPNDVPMFRAVGHTQPGLRVAMPHASDETLVSLSNVRAEVSDVLEKLCNAKQRAA